MAENRPPRRRQAGAPRRQGDGGPARRRSAGGPSRWQSEGGPPRAVRQRVFSQNFLVDRRAIETLVGGSGVGPGDLVLDLGAGNGLITQAIARRGARVVAIERDPALVQRLRDRFGPGSGVTVVAGDILTASLPREPFAVVANIPFGITTKILRRLLGDNGGRLRQADVIVQAEVARKRGTRGRGTLLNATWEPWFEFDAGPRVPRAAFRPQPRVDGAVLIARRRSVPLVDLSLRRAYGTFITGAFGGAKPTVASALTRSVGGVRAVSKPRFGKLAADLGFPSDALPSQLTGEQWAGLFLGVSGQGSPGPGATGRAPRRGGRPAP